MPAVAPGDYQLRLYADYLGNISLASPVPLVVQQVQLTSDALFAPIGGTVRANWGGLVSQNPPAWIGLFPSGSAGPGGWYSKVYLNTCEPTYTSTAAPPLSAGSCPIPIPEILDDDDYELQIYGDLAGLIKLAPAVPVKARKAAPNRMTLQVQYQSVVLNSIALEDWTGQGVSVATALAGLTMLRAMPRSVPAGCEAVADAALQTTRIWIANRPPNGVWGRVSQSEYWHIYGQPCNNDFSFRWDVENYVGGNLRG